MRIRLIIIGGLSAGMCLTSSCSLVKVPFKVVGGVAKATVWAGKKIHKKSKESRQRRKEENREQELAAREAAVAEREAMLSDGVLPAPRGFVGEAGSQGSDLIVEPLPQQATLPALPE